MPAFDADDRCLPSLRCCAFGRPQTNRRSSRGKLRSAVGRSVFASQIGRFFRSFARFVFSSVPGLSQGYGRWEADVGLLAVPLTLDVVHTSCSSRACGAEPNDTSHPHGVVRVVIPSHYLLARVRFVRFGRGRLRKLAFLPPSAHRPLALLPLSAWLVVDPAFRSSPSSHAHPSIALSALV